MALRGAAVLAVAAAIAGSAVACNIILQTSSYSACTSVSDAGWYGGDCLSCVEANCCDKAAACAADPGCACVAGGYPLMSCPLEAGVHASADGTSIDAGPFGTCTSMACGGECGGPWACAGLPRWPSLPPDAGDVTITLVPTLFNGNVTVPDTPAFISQVTVFGCQGCPMHYEGLPAGPVKIDVPSGFGGYLDVVPAADGGADNSPLRSFVYLVWPIAADTTIDLRFLTTGKLPGLEIAAGVSQPDADAGTLVVFARRCDGNPAPGVTLTPAPGHDPDPFSGSDGFNFPDGLPAQAGNSSGPQTPTTDSDGIAGWANLNTTDSALIASFAATVGGGVPQIGTVNVLVQAQTVTYVWLTPMPPP